MTEPHPTSAPWVLILWGGKVIGQRPRTRLAKIETRRELAGGGFVYMGRTVKDRGQLTKHARPIYRGEILAAWSSVPTVAELRRVRRSLRPST